MAKTKRAMKSASCPMKFAVTKAKTKAKRKNAKAMAKAVAKAVDKRVAIDIPPRELTDKEVAAAKKALVKLGYNADMEANPKAKRDSVAAKGGGKGKRQGSGGKVLKRPSSKVHRAGPLVTAHGLQDVQLKPYDLIKFNAMMQNEDNAMSVPPEIQAEWAALKKVKGNKGQQDAQDAIRRAWKMDSTWGHPMIRQKIMRTHSKSIKVLDKAIIWHRMCVKLGSPENALEALRNKDILCVTNPHDSTKRLYIMREHVNEELWENANILAGEAEAKANDEEIIEAMVSGWMENHDNGWDSLIEWTDAEHVPMPASGPSPCQRAMPAPQPMPEHDPNYNGGPTAEAKMESTIKRFLSQVCSIKSRPVSVPALYQYQYMYQYQYLYKC